MYFSRGTIFELEIPFYSGESSALTPNIIKWLTNFLICAFRNAKKATERIENMKAELEEAEKREKEILEEKETLEKDCNLSSERAAQLKVSYSTLLIWVLNLSV